MTYGINDLNKTSLHLTWKAQSCSSTQELFPFYEYNLKGCGFLSFHCQKLLNKDVIHEVITVLTFSIYKILKIFYLFQDRWTHSIISNQTYWEHRNFLGVTNFFKQLQVKCVIIITKVDHSFLRIFTYPFDGCSSVCNTSWDNVGFTIHFRHGTRNVCEWYSFIYNI